MTNTRTSLSLSLSLCRRPAKGLVAAALAALTLATALSGGGAHAQTADVNVFCKSQIDAENALKAMDNAPGFMLDEARRDVRDCKYRFYGTEHERARSERSRAGNAYANSDSPQERRDAIDAWNEANDKAKQQEGNDASLGNQPYNDGLSDFERYYCIEDTDAGEDGVQVRGSQDDLPDYGGSESQNVTSVTCPG